MMRAGVSSVQQTLTAEAAAILKHAVAEACKRGHAQATPLHVAATLLVAPSSVLRRACLQTHPHSSHLPQCRALELCFNIALERLQAAQGPLPNGQPSYSNALVAALKRAQAHQRRGCPEQQQQPLLAVKVELEQLVISILDDPSVSRVMREAGFSSTDVKSHLEEMASIMTSHHSVSHSVSDPVRLPLGASAMDQMGFSLRRSPSILGGFPLSHHLTPLNGNGAILPGKNDGQLHIPPMRMPSPYMNPILLKPGLRDTSLGASDDVKQVLDVLVKKSKRNPVLLGDSAARVENVMRVINQQMERGDVSDQLHGVKFLSANLSFVSLLNARKEDLHMRFVELNKSVEELIRTGGAVVNVGNLQWLLQLRASPSKVAGFCPVQHAAHQIRELYSRHQDSGRVWLIGMATTQSYRSCLALYPALESQWDLQPIPIGPSGQFGLSSRSIVQESGIGATDSLTLSLLPASATELQLSSSSEEAGEQLTCCQDCCRKYEKEVYLLQEQEARRQPDSPQSCSSSVETPSKAPNEQGTQSTCSTQPALPLWLQRALPNGATSIASPPVEGKDKILSPATGLQDLRKKWNRTCKSRHGERVPNLSTALDLWQQQSPPSSQISGNPLGRCQEQAFSLLRENVSSSGSTRPIVGMYPALNGPSRAMSSSLASSNLHNGISDQLLQINTLKDRVQEDSTSCSASKVRLPWQAPAAAPMLRSTDAAPPGSASEMVYGGEVPRMLLRMGPDALGQLCKALAKKVHWQPRIISTIASTVIQCRCGFGKRTEVGFKSDTWLLFLGQDRPGKRLMAEALAEYISGGDKKPISLTFGKSQDLSSPALWSLGLSAPSRGKMPLDQLSDAVRYNPLSVVYLEDVEQADAMFRNSLLRALSKGRLVDSSGREVTFSNVIVVMASSVGTNSIKAKCTGSNIEDGFSEEIARLSSGKEALECSTVNGRVEAPNEHLSLSKRKGDWDAGTEATEKELGTSNKKPNLGLSLDLNMSAEENDKADCPVSSREFCEVDSSTKPEVSDEAVLLSARKQLGEFCDLVDATVIFGSPL